MSVIRVEKTKNYTVMSNYHFKEKEMTLKAKGLLSLILSLPDNWDYSISGLVSICKENETAIRSALKELQEFGYMKIDKIMPDKTKSGRIEYVYTIYEKPIQKGKKQGLENLCVENQDIENPIQLNTKQLNTYNKNTKKINTKKNYIKKDSFPIATTIEKTCLENDITDDKVIELIEEFFKENRIKTKGAIEANIGKIAGRSPKVIEQCIKLSNERNYKFIADPKWLETNTSNGCGNNYKKATYYNSNEDHDTNKLPKFASYEERMAYIDSLPYDDEI